MINCTHRIIRQTKDIVFFCYSDKKELCMGVFSARNVKRSYDEFCKKPAKVKVKVKIAKNKVKAAPKRGGRKRRRAFLEDFRSRGHQFDTVNKIERSYETRVYRLFESNDKNEIKIRHALREMVKNHSWSQIEVQRSQIRQRSTGDDDCNNEDDDPGAKDQNAPGANDEGENKEENK
uniref:Uncharacterized protein n=1 Tax=Romanomermis culicivorax TaxID=13658 RepID=A0A915K4G5_ROMCU